MPRNDQETALAAAAPPGAAPWQVQGAAQGGQGGHSGEHAQDGQDVTGQSGDDRIEHGHHMSRIAPVSSSIDRPVASSSAPLILSRLMTVSPPCANPCGSSSR